jgi:hypothetical protein
VQLSDKFDAKVLISMRGCAVCLLCMFRDAELRLMRRTPAFSASEILSFYQTGRWTHTGYLQYYPFSNAGITSSFINDGNLPSFHPRMIVDQGGRSFDAFMDSTNQNLLESTPRAPLCASRTSCNNDNGHVVFDGSNEVAWNYGNQPKVLSGNDWT